MNEKEKHNIHYTTADIEKYLRGEMSADDMHHLEKAALDDPFLSDAIEGMQQSMKTISPQTFRKDIDELTQQLQQRTKRKNKIIALTNQNWWQIAAAIVILIAGGSLTYYYVSKNVISPAPIAAKKEDAKAITTDTIKNAPSTDVKADSATASVAAESHRKTSSRKTNRADNKNDDIKKDIANNAGPAKNERLSGQNENKPAPSSVAVEKDKSAKENEASTQPAQNYFSGKVIDQNNKPIAMASVELKNKKIATTTDNNGNFRLNSNDVDTTVNAEIKSIGYEPAVATLNNNRSSNIVLHESNHELNDVVVTGYGKKRKAQNAEPQKGWAEFNKYLSENKKPPQDSTLTGPVIVSFTVKTDGKPSDFIIKQSLAPAYDAEAIRLIKEGPAWKLLKGKSANVTVTVNF